MSNIKNSRKDAFLAQIPKVSIDDLHDTLAGRSKFNFSYFDVQEAGQSFEGWSHEQLYKLLEKLKHYSAEPLKYWMSQRCGAGSRKILTFYDQFPSRSSFKRPVHIPHQAIWGRFRLESAVRVVGFVLPSEFDKKLHPGTGYVFDCNTFYVVFLDAEHKFFETEAK